MTADAADPLDTNDRKAGPKENSSPRPESAADSAPADASQALDSTAAAVPAGAASNAEAPPPLPARTEAPAWWRALSPGARLLVLAALVAAFGWLLQVLAPALAPFMFGAILAYVGTPAVAWLARHRVPRVVGALLMIVTFAALLFGLLVVVAPLVSNEIAQISAKAPDLISRVQTEWLPWLNQTFGLSLAFDLSQLKTLAQDNAGALGQLSSQVAGSLKLGGQMLLGVLVNLMLVPVVMFYLLRDWPGLVDGVDALVPRTVRPMVRELAREIDAVLSEFLRGQMLVMLALALYYCIALRIAGLQFWLPVGLVTGLLVFVPYVGFGLGLSLGMLAALTQFSSAGPILGVAAVFALGQVLEGFILTPTLVGDRIGLHPLAVIFALMAFGQLFGFVGVLLALPASAALLVALRTLRRELSADDAPGAR